MKMGRTHTPCRVCGDTHTNPRSSSLCPACGAVEAEAHREREADERRLARRRHIHKEQQLDDAETVHDLREWIKEYLL